MKLKVAAALFFMACGFVMGFEFHKVITAFIVILLMLTLVPLTLVGWRFRHRHQVQVAGSNSTQIQAGRDIR